MKQKDLEMNVSRINQHNMELDRMVGVREKDNREEEQRKTVEKKNLEMIIAERVARNMRMDRDKGRYIDVEV